MAAILIVDDQATNRDYLTTLLSYGGHRLMEASDGAEALARRPTLVLRRGDSRRRWYAGARGRPVSAGGHDGLDSRGDTFVHLNRDHV